MISNKKIYLLPLSAYQYVSRLLPGSCRYYPTCSEYAKWHFELNTPHTAFAKSGLRILRCNQLFEGGIDYPLIKYKIPLLLTLNQNLKKIKYWIVPKEKNWFYIIKDYDAY